MVTTSAGTKPQRGRFSGGVPRGHSIGDDGKSPGSHRRVLPRWGFTGPSLPSQESKVCVASAPFHAPFHAAGSSLPTGPATPAQRKLWCKYPTLLGSRVHQAGQHPKGVQGCPGWGRAWTGTSRVLPARPRAGTLMSWLSASTLFFPQQPSHQEWERGVCRPQGSLGAETPEGL